MNWSALAVFRIAQYMGKSIFLCIQPVQDNADRITREGIITVSELEASLFCLGFLVFLGASWQLGKGNIC